MNDFEIEFERYITNKWMLPGKHYNLHGIYSFYENLWDGGVSELDTPYGSVKKVDYSTGYKDGEEERIMVLQIGDKFFKKFGSYDSWDSANWEGRLIEVKPVEKTVTVYEAV